MRSFCLLLVLLHFAPTSFALPTVSKSDTRIETARLEELARDEKEPLHLGRKAKPQEVTAGFGYSKILPVVLSLLLAAGATVLVVFLLKKRGFRTGNRKYLIEQLSYCSLGPKTAVALLRVGNELVLVGITPQQITHLSSVPKLQNRYDEESKYERDAFEAAVGEEIKNLRTSRPLSV